ncbi:cell division protein ZapE [Chiayiivirga flava]|nr:cell division protein ZapE [Chiayiivirga flava]
MRPGEAYAAGVASGRWTRDAAQLAVLAELDRIHDGLLERASAGALTRLAQRLRPPPPVRGLYLWGGVGRGKTFLVDLFFEHLALEEKRRVHFHRFMGEVHARIRALGEHADPLARIAAEYAREARVLCLDEFFVSDIGDAMLLARMLDQLFARGVTLLTTSNTPPRELYRDGLQRASFVPAIDLIERHCTVHEMRSTQDYRLRALTHAPVYHAPLGAGADAALQSIYERLTCDTAHTADTLTINARAIPVIDHAEGAVWFEFAALCEGPRSVADYIEIARHFHTVLLAHVPLFDRMNEDAAQRFVLLVDELYDRNVNLIVSAAAGPTALYGGRRLVHEFRRTESRLIEMQSEDYLARAHRP